MFDVLRGCFTGAKSKAHYNSIFSIILGKGTFSFLQFNRFLCFHNNKIGDIPRKAR